MTALTKKNNLYCQRGNTLILILMFLALMAMMGLTAMQGSTLQEKMAGNLRDRNFAMLAAEDALRIAEAFAQSQADAAFDNNSDGLFNASADSTPDPFDSTSWTDTATRRLNELVTDGFITSNELVAGVQLQPSFYIQFLGEYSEPCRMGRPDLCVTVGAGMFRIVTRGTGVSSNSVVVLESYFSR